MVNKPNGKQAKADKDKPATQQQQQQQSQQQQSQQQQQQQVLQSSNKNNNNNSNNQMINSDNKAKNVSNKCNSNNNNSSRGKNGGNNKSHQQQQQQQQQQRSSKKARPQRQKLFFQPLSRNSNSNQLLLPQDAANSSSSSKSSIHSSAGASNKVSNTNILTTTTTATVNDAGHVSISKVNPGDLLTAALAAVPCAKCSKPAMLPSSLLQTSSASSSLSSTSSSSSSSARSDMSSSSYSSIGSDQTQSLDSASSSAVPQSPIVYTSKQYRKSKSYMGVPQYANKSTSTHSSNNSSNSSNNSNSNNSSNNNSNSNHVPYRRSQSDRRNSFDRSFAERNRDFVPIVQPLRPVLSSSNIAGVIASASKLTIIERFGKGRVAYPIMQCGTLDGAAEPLFHQQRNNRMDVYQIDDGFHSDGGTETPPPSPSSGSSIASTSDHGSLESVDTGGTQRLAVLSFEQVRKLHDVMDEVVAIHGRGNFPTLEVTLKDLVNLVRRKLEADVNSGGAGVLVKDIRLNGGAASHVLANEDQQYNDLDLIFAIELSSPRVFDRVKTAVLNTLLDLMPEGVCKRRIYTCSLKEAYVGKMVKVNNNNDGDRWSLISLGNSPGHKNVELKFVDTMRRQFEFSVDSFQIVLDSLLLFYDCAALPISENFYPTVVGESVYGDFQEALYHLQKKLISTRQPEEIRGGGLLKYCNLLVRNYTAVDSQLIKTLERYMCSRFFIDFPDINTQTTKLEAYLRNHFWGIDEEPLQYEYLMHLYNVVEMSTVCLMGHERRQTLLLIHSLANQVKQAQEHQYQQQQQQQHHQQQHHQQQQQHHQQQQHQQQQQQQQQHHSHQQQQHQFLQQQQQQSPLDAQQAQQTSVLTLVSTPPQTPQTQTIYVQQATAPAATICCSSTAPATTTVAGAAGTAVATTASVVDAQQQQQQSQQPQTIQIQAGPPGLIYANGVYYAPVIPSTICTCNSTWLST